MDEEKPSSFWPLAMASPDGKILLPETSQIHVMNQLSKKRNEVISSHIFLRLLVGVLQLTISIFLSSIVLLSEVISEKGDHDDFS